MVLPMLSTRERGPGPLATASRGLLVGVSVGLLTTTLTGCGGEDARPGAGSRTIAASPSASAGPTPGDLTSGAPTPQPKPPRIRSVTVPPAELASARTSTRGYVEALANVLSAPKSATDQGSRAGSARGVTGTALAQLKSQAYELAENGLHLEGTPRIVSSAITRRTTNPRTLTVSVCLDNSAVKLVDNAGKQQPSTSSARSRNTLELVQRDGEWLVAGQSFPDNPDC